METPNKIFITPNFQRRWFTKDIDEDCIEYIRKDELLKWLEKVKYRYNYDGDTSPRPKDDYFYTKANTICEVIDKLNSL